jgi:hypothetical protein
MRDIEAIINAVNHLREAFRDNDLTPPTSIELSSIDDAFAFSSVELKYSGPIEPRYSDPMVAARIMGIEIRYPRHHQPFKP